MAAEDQGHSNIRGNRPFHMRRWLSIQQAVDHLTALSEEPLTSDDLARLALEQRLNLYWYRPGQKLRYIDRPNAPSIDMQQPLRLSSDHNNDWPAIVGILRQQPALPLGENDTPVLQDADGNLLQITFDLTQRPEPFSGRWYPFYTELMVKRAEIDRLESQLFELDDEHALEPHLLLDVIWQLEQLALENGRTEQTPSHDMEWLTRELSQRAHIEPGLLGRVLHAAERQHNSSL